MLNTTTDVILWQGTRVPVSIIHNTAGEGVRATADAKPSDNLGQRSELNTIFLSSHSQLSSAHCSFTHGGQVHILPALRILFGREGPQAVARMRWQRGDTTDAGVALLTIRKGARPLHWATAGGTSALGLSATGLEP